MAKQNAVKKEDTKSASKYLRGVRSEFKKVVWPTKSEIINYSIIVIVTSILFSLLLAGFDWIVHQVLKLIIG